MAENSGPATPRTVKGPAAHHPRGPPLVATAVIAVTAGALKRAVATREPNSVAPGQTIWMGRSGSCGSGFEMLQRG
jgi:hypothetical protein